MESLLERPKHLSPSSLDTFQTCPLKYRLSRIEKLGEGSTEAQVVGNYVHDVLESLLSQPAHTRTIQAAKELLKHHWLAERFDEEGKALPSWGEQLTEIEPNEEKLRQIRWRCWWAVENYFRIEDPTKVNVGEAETRIDVEIAGVPVHGFVDRWDLDGNRVNITDYKTGKTPKKPYQAKKFQQLLIYADAISQTLDREPHLMTLLFLKEGHRLQQNVTQENLDDMRYTLSSVWDAITARCEAEYFEPTPSVLCGWCDFKPICPAHGGNYDHVLSH